MTAMNSSQGENGRSDAVLQGNIAIIGMACMFPGAPDLTTYWQNIVSKVDAVTDPPPEAWSPDVFYSPDSTANDRVYCKRGGFLGPIAYFDPLKHGIMPSALDGSEPDQWLALQVARAAFEDAGYTGDIPERHRTAVILGKGTYLNRGNLTAAQHGQVVDQTLGILRTLHPEYSQVDLQHIRQELKHGLPPFNADTAGGLIPNVAVGRIANRLDLMGPSYTIDAACASSLVAVDIARRDLLTRRCDLALVGGIHIVTPVPVLMLFCHLGALSHRQEIRPFDQDADGTILSEGVGMAVVKRLEDAVRDGNRIYAVIKGVGVASDGRALSVLAPRVEGEELALQRAYEQAAIAPQSIGLIEAHGTATLVGDATEIQALTRVLGERKRGLPACALGTIKSMIGHTMPAAGMAGLIKSALALYHRTLPPTIHVDRPSARLELEKTPFYINTETRPWVHGSTSTPRRAGVNAFGFGGINAHVILEEYPDADESTAVGHLVHWETEVCILEGATRADLIAQGEQLRQFLDATPVISLKDLAYTLNSELSTTKEQGGARLALVVSSLEDLQRRLERALTRLANPNARKIKDVNGTYFVEEPLGRSGKLAFLFAGEGSQYVNMLSDLLLHFPRVRACFDAMDRVFEHHTRGYVPSDFIFPRPGFSEAEREEAERRLWQMDIAIEAVVTANHALFTLLDDLGIQPDAILGHSSGEFSAMRAAGMLETDGYDQRLLELNRRYHQVATQGGIPEATLLAVGAGREQVMALIEEVGNGLQVAMDNCPHQTVLAGPRSAIDRVLEQAQRHGYICELLSFDRAYHTPLYAPYAAVMREFMSEWIVATPPLPVYSCTTTTTFPANLDETRRIAHEHWLRPVEFRQTVERMYEDGIRLFVEVSPRANLTAFVEDILRGRSHLAVPIDVMRRSGTTQLNHLIALLATHAIPMRLETLYARRVPRRVDIDHPADPYNEGKQPGVRVKLSTGWPPMGISEDTAADLRSRHQTLQVPVANEQGHDGSFAGYDGTSSKQALRATTVVAQQNVDSTNGDRMSLSQGNHNPHSGNGNIALSKSTQPLRADDHAAPTASQQPPRQVPSITIGTIADVGTAQVMSAYLQTMEQFLIVQQEVVQAFLIGRQSAVPQGPQVAAPTVVPPSMAPALTNSVTASSLYGEPERTVVAQMEHGAVPTVPTHDSHEMPGVPAAIADPRAMTAASPAGPITLDPATIGQLLLHIVSDKTGYPAEMLDLNLDLEADLGIDSIKRVEILGAFQQESKLRLGEQMDQISTRKTLQEVIDLVVECRTDAVAQAERDSSANTPPTALSEAPPGGSSRFPFVDNMVALTPGGALVAQFEVSLATCPFLRDHSLGRHVALTDPDLPGQPIMPLTMSMEILAQGAAVLMPHWRLVAMKEIRAYSWIALDREAITLQISAGKTPQQGEVHVQIHELRGVDGSVGKNMSPIVEGIMVFAEEYPPPPVAAALQLQEELSSKWPPERLYKEAMFHGPAFRGVASMDRVGADGAEATLEVLSLDGLLPSSMSRAWITDPVLLDQPGQVVGFWAAQSLERGYLVFPFRVEALHLYAGILRPGERLTCRARIALISDQQTRADLDVIRADGSVYARFDGWWDRRFDLPRSFYRLLLAPGETVLSEVWHIGESQGLHARRLSLQAFPNALLTVHGGIWQRVLACLMLGRRERVLWNDLPQAQRLPWLIGRVVAKDAVRQYVQQHCGLYLHPADVEILPDEHGQPIINGAWTDQVPHIPVLSLSHAHNAAVAIVAVPRRGAGLGLAITTRDSMGEAEAQPAFSAGEQALLTDMPEAERAEWMLRLWCAKEAVAKALGFRIDGGLQALVAQAIDTSSGEVHVRLNGEFTSRIPQLAGASLSAFTTREADSIAAVALWEGVETHETKS